MKTAPKIIKSIFRTRRKTTGRFCRIGWFREKVLKHQEDQLVKQLSFGTLKIAYRRPWELLHTYREIFEQEIYKFNVKKRSPLIIDCGSNIGISVLYYKAIYPNATVIAFEPDSNNFDLLQQNVALNSLQQIHLHRQAVWKTKGTISFSASSSEASHILQEQEIGMEVQTVRLFDVLTANGVVDFLKIDIEGAEWEVLKDCAQALANVQNLFLEYHGKASETHKLLELLTIVKEAGFQVYIKMAADNMNHPFIEKTLPLPYDVQLNLFCYR